MEPQQKPCPRWSSFVSNDWQFVVLTLCALCDWFGKKAQGIASGQGSTTCDITRRMVGSRRGVLGPCGVLLLALGCAGAIPTLEQQPEVSRERVSIGVWSSGDTAIHIREADGDAFVLEYFQGDFEVPFCRASAFSPDADVIPCRVPFEPCAVNLTLEVQDHDLLLNVVAAAGACEVDERAWELRPSDIFALGARLHRSRVEPGGSAAGLTRLETLGSEPDAALARIAKELWAAGRLPMRLERAASSIRTVHRRLEMRCGGFPPAGECGQEAVAAAVNEVVSFEASSMAEDEAELRRRRAERVHIAPLNNGGFWAGENAGMLGHGGILELVPHGEGHIALFFDGLDSWAPACTFRFEGNLVGEFSCDPSPRSSCGARIVRVLERRGALVVTPLGGAEAWMCVANTAPEWPAEFVVRPTHPFSVLYLSMLEPGNGIPPEIFGGSPHAATAPVVTRLAAAHRGSPAVAGIHLGQRAATALMFDVMSALAGRCGTPESDGSRPQCEESVIDSVIDGALISFAAAAPGIEQAL